MSSLYILGTESNSFQLKCCNFLNIVIIVFLLGLRETHISENSIISEEKLFDYYFTNKVTFPLAEVMSYRGIS